MPTQTRSFTADRDSASDVRGFLAEIARGAGVRPRVRFDTLLAASEAANYAIEHGGPCDAGRFHVTAAIDDREFRVEVCDCGRIIRRDFGEGNSDYALAIMEAAVDAVEIRTERERTCVLLRKRR
jgi:anti-sigma regulatory factor (Ser/Thr protein kinase)